MGFSPQKEDIRLVLHRSTRSLSVIHSVERCSTLVSCFLNKHVIIDNGGFTVEGIFLAFKPSRKHPFHEPFTLILLTKQGKAVLRDWQVIKVK